MTWHHNWYSIQTSHCVIHYALWRRLLFMYCPLSFIKTLLGQFADTININILFVCFLASHHSLRTQCNVSTVESKGSTHKGCLCSHSLKHGNSSWTLAWESWRFQTDPCLRRAYEKPGPPGGRKKILSEVQIIFQLVWWELNCSYPTLWTSLLPDWGCSLSFHESSLLGWRWESSSYWPDSSEAPDLTSPVCPDLHLGCPVRHRSTVSFKPNFLNRIYSILFLVCLKFGFFLCQTWTWEISKSKSLQTNQKAQVFGNSFHCFIFIFLIRFLMSALISVKFIILG